MAGKAHYGAYKKMTSFKTNYQLQANTHTKLQIKGEYKFQLTKGRPVSRYCLQALY